VTEGLNRLGFGSDVGTKSSLEDPTELLKHIKASTVPGIYVLCDFHPFIKDEPVNVRLLREIAMRYHDLGHTIILLSHEFTLPKEVKRYSVKFELSMPTEEQLENPGPRRSQFLVTIPGRTCRSERFGNIQKTRTESSGSSTARGTATGAGGNL
jgi:hypothetical protein